ncbi:MAG: hypothetical protein WA326_03205 [Nitrososphaeraceae archaeon]
MINHSNGKSMVPLGTRLVLLLVMFFSSVLLSPTIINVTFAIDMPDAPVTQDTVTAGGGEEDNNDEDDEDKDQPDGLPNPEDAPVTTETITSGKNEGSKEDKGNEENNDEADGTNVLNDSNTAVSPVGACAMNQERTLFGGACTPTDIQSNECDNDPLNVGCQNTASQMQGDENAGSLPSEQLE